ncbi:putative lipoprotein [Pseudomonas chlororaphis subsp. aureofaciens]|uniref:DNA-packaging protein n=1 Tax=Pseudomonas chlororaphis TaxID=587753 RepID=UPI000F56E9C1|nr:DNA-packaging protein [Pseudomonas chlororaphis]AZE10193.1 putative lipoprotein [Pseudomonas chlororaphis subsp. aureofaciens]
MKSLFNLISPATWYVALVVVVVYGLHLNHQDGYDQGFAQAKADGAAEIASLREAHALEKQTATARALDDLQAEQAKGNQLASQLADARDNLRKTTDKLTGEITHVTKLYRRAIDAQPEPLPACVFTTGFVRVWNAANGVSTAMPAQNTTSGTAAPSNGAGAADELDSGIGQGQVLFNQIRNGEQYGACRAQLNRMIDWALSESR